MPATFCELKQKENMAETAGNIVETRSCQEDSARVEKIPVCCLLIVSEKSRKDNMAGCTKRCGRI